MQPRKGASCPRVEGFLTRLYPPPCWTAHHLSPPLSDGQVRDSNQEPVVWGSTCAQF